MKYSSIGGLAWREGEELTLVLIDRMRDFGRKLTVPESCYGAARRVLRDKIAAHDIHFTGNHWTWGFTTSVTTSDCQDVIDRRIHDVQRTS